MSQRARRLGGHTWKLPTALSQGGGGVETKSASQLFLTLVREKAETAIAGNPGTSHESGQEHKDFPTDSCNNCVGESVSTQPRTKSIDMSRVQSDLCNTGARNMWGGAGAHYACTGSCYEGPCVQAHVLTTGCAKTCFTHACATGACTSLVLKRGPLPLCGCGAGTLVFSLVGLSSVCPGVLHSNFCSYGVFSAGAACEANNAKAKHSHNRIICTLGLLCSG